MCACACVCACVFVHCACLRMFVRARTQDMSFIRKETSILCLEKSTCTVVNILLNFPVLHG